MADEMTEPVQPEEGQGGEVADAPPYAEYLDRIPEEARDAAEEAFKAWDASTTQRFQEAAEYRRSWEPFEQLGVQDRTPEQMQWLLQFDEALANPQAIKEWYEAYAGQYGLTPDQQQQQAEQSQQQQQPGVDEWGTYTDPQQLQQVLSQALSPVQDQLKQLAEWREQQEYQSRVAEASQFVSSQLEELKAAHPSEFEGERGKETEAGIEALVAQYIEADPQHAVPRAFADWQRFRGSIEKAYVDGKLNQPAPAEGGGVASTAPEEVKDFAQAGEIALARLREMNRAG